MSFRPHGKPMRALRILATAEKPLHEDDVWQRAKHDGGEWSAGAMWYGPLKRLHNLGLVERDGSSGGYRYTITGAGREMLR